MTFAALFMDPTDADVFEWVEVEKHATALAAERGWVNPVIAGRDEMEVEVPEGTESQSFTWTHDGVTWNVELEVEEDDEG